MTLARTTAARDTATARMARAAICLLCFTAASGALGAAMMRAEAWTHEPMPPGFRVEATDLDGPVFADARGRTLYRWPFKGLRNGVTGDAKGESNCGEEKASESTGYMSPYPGGFLLPERDTRPSCAQMWPPARATAQAEPIGKWSLITRKDGARQWAYEGAALYTSARDHRPGDVLGGDSFGHRGDYPAVREPIAPLPDVPPGFAVSTTLIGRMLQTDRNYSVYVSDHDKPGRSNCTGQCAQTWIPMLAPLSARPHGDWSIIERAPGQRQWAFRRKPLYRYALDSKQRSQEGSDVAGWHNVFTQTVPAPAQFTVQDTSSGQVLADQHGMTIYTYFCGDDALDQLGCDHPSETQVYRLALCGGGDAQRCVRNFPYVLAAKGARSRSHLWSIINIDPITGRVAQRGQPGALRVWAFRERPVYTFSGDTQPGDVNADAFGEFRSERQGFKAYWLRDDFFRDNG